MRTCVMKLPTGALTPTEYVATGLRRRVYMIGWAKKTLEENAEVDINALVEELVANGICGVTHEMLGRG